MPLSATVRRATLAAAVLFAAWPAQAGAHSIVRVNGGEVTSLSADATSLNTLTARMSGARVELRDPTVDGGIDPGSCEPGEVDKDGFVIQVFCPAGNVSLVRLDVGDREDQVTAELPMPVALLGGEGADVLRTGPAADTVAGDAGDDELVSGPGNDTLVGGLGVDRADAGAGNDTIRVRDGLADSIVCGEGSDRVEADTVDDVATDCENVERVATPPPPDEGGSARDRTPPRVETGGSTIQRLGRSASITLAATSSERGTIAASGALVVGGAALPLSSRRVRVAVAGAGAELRIRLSRSQQRLVQRALRRGRRVTVRLEVVATDAAGNSAAVRAPRIRLRR